MRIRNWLERMRSAPPPIGRDIAWLQAAHSRMDVSVPAGSVLFLGDSNTFTLVTAAVAPLSVNYGIGSLRSDQLLAAMPIYHSMTRARAVSIMIGTNDVLEGLSAGLQDRYARILDQIPSGVSVVLSSIPPIERPGLREQAQQAAQAARRASEGRCRFVDLHSALEGIPGALTDDGVHLDVKGYAIWAELLRRALP
jgi:lysophospholipase L1-like esterase